MADNKNYPVLGFDLFEGNDVNDWAALRRAAKFLYLRSSIGVAKDAKFVSFAQAADRIMLPFGAFHEARPNWSVSAQVRTYKEQYHAAGVIQMLPTAIAYEIQSVKDTKTGRVTRTWPNPKDLASFMVDDPGVIVYTNEAGLKIILAAGLDVSAWQFWYANYMEHQAADGEQDIEKELAYLQTKYGIKKEQVLFFQTADAIPYPDPAISPDKGADYDRVVSFAPLLPPAPDPTPVPVPVPDTTWQAAAAAINARVDDLTARVTVLEHEAPKPNVPPPPAPEPPKVSNIWTLKTREELGIPHDGSFNAILGHGQKNNLILLQPELDFIFSITGHWYGYQTDNAQLRQWAIGPGNIYILPVGGADDTHPAQVDWPVILCGSTPFMRQRVHVLEFSNDGQHIIGKPGRVARIEAFQKASTYGWQGNPNNADYLFMWMWTDFKPSGYGPSHTFPDSRSYVFVMPLFDPASTFPRRKGTIPGFWISADGLKEQVA